LDEYIFINHNRSFAATILSISTCIPPLLPVIVLHFYAPSFRLAQTQQYPGVQYFVFFRHRQEIESMVAAKDRLWLIKIYSSNRKSEGR
jgi:glycerol-3-phosphate acyltransferase PlsY